jgi:hypothetical protein
VRSAALVALVSAGLPAVAAPVARAASPNAVVFEYNGTAGADGSVQTYSVPAGVTRLHVEAWGAQGGGSIQSCGGGTVYPGGFGGHVSGVVTVTPGDVVRVRVGGVGGDPEHNCATAMPAVRAVSTAAATAGTRRRQAPTAWLAPAAVAPATSVSVVTPSLIGSWWPAAVGAHRRRRHRVAPAAG